METGRERRGQARLMFHRAFSPFAWSRKARHGLKYRSLNEMLKKMIAIAALGASVVVLTGCNTVKGLGRDIESVGEAGDRAI